MHHLSAEDSRAEVEDVLILEEKDNQKAQKLAA